ncbi:MAG: tonB-system energizer ExbB [Alphaproteobacteria bacterium PA2]|jgi:biopolymer transport protein ExbB|nr:MAG: tonB-system energizer ExbB [Alphaproteobacteria bacterium PA2]
MLDIKRTTPFIALLGAIALMSSAPAFAADPAPAAPAAADAAAPAAADAAAPAAEAAAPAAEAAPAEELPPQMKNAGKAGVFQMFIDADPVVKTVMIGLLLCSVLSWAILVTKAIEFNGLNKTATAFLEAFRGAKTINEIGRTATSEEFEGNPLADMAAAAAQEVELSRQAGLAVSGEHRESTQHRAEAAVSAVQSSLGTRLSSGMQFLASVGSSGPFIGLFGTVYGIMNSFIGIANTNTTNLAVVAPGIAEALLATGIGLFAAIPSVIFYNYFQTRISALGARSEGFVSELMNAISRQLDKGA